MRREVRAKRIMERRRRAEKRRIKRLVEQEMRSATRMEEECVEETYYEEEQDHGDDGIPYPYPSPYCVYLSVLNSVLLVCDAYYYVMC